MSCAACGIAIFGDEESLRCSLDKCGKLYHLLCAGGRKPADSTGEWICPECRCATKKGGDNSLTPVGTSKSSREPNVTYRKIVPMMTTTKVQNTKSTDQTKEPKMARMEKCHHTEDTDLSAEIRGLRHEMAVLKNQLSAAVAIIMSYETKMECYTTHVQALHDKIDQKSVCCRPVDSHQPRHEVAPPKCSATAPIVESKPNKSHKIVKKNSQVKPNPQLLVSPVTVDAESASAGRSDVPSVSILPSINAEVLAVDDQQQPWTEVKTRNRRPASLCGTAGPAITSLKAVEPRSFIHLWNMESSAEEVRLYLSQLCPVGTCTVDVLTPRGDYKSYKLGVPAAFSEVCLSTNVWPVNARIKPWVTYRQPAGPSKIKGNHQPFRRPAATQ